MVRHMVAELYSALSEDMKTRTRKKIQSAMEYLMTYGWAILIIAVVLVVLFSLGITNPLFFAPKAPPGSCQIVRPNGPGTTTDIALEGGGLCTMLPEFTSTLAPVTTNHGYYSINSILQMPTGSNPWTITAWVYDNNAGPNTPNIDCMVFSYGYINGVRLEIDGDGYYEVDVNGGYYDQISNPFPNYNWMFITASYDGKTLSDSITFNGKTYSASTTAASPYLTPGLPAYIGWDLNHPDECPASIANVQIYNTALNPAAINSLYLEGIGGAPQELNNVVGWWPLNGNANDYSGNNNDGTANNIVWSGNWWQQGDYVIP
jgi:hypothetical protein